MSISYESDMTVGVELEFPQTAPEAHPLASTGQESGDLVERVEHRVSTRGRATYDGTVGLEYVSDQMDISHGADWLADSIYEIESEGDASYCPCSLMNGSTAGLHVHVSPLDEETARGLFELSKTPEMQALACSGIADPHNPTAPVFRSGRYCSLEFDQARYSVVHNVRGDHWEWRLPEPVDRATFKHVLKALDLVKTKNVKHAHAYVDGVLKTKPDDVMSIRRAKKVGIEEANPVEVTRNPRNPTPFFQAVSDSASQPYIYRVEIGKGEFYGFHTNSYTLDDFRSITVDGEKVDFKPKDVLRIGSLERVDKPEIRSEVRDAISAHRSGSDRPRRETEATKKVKQSLAFD